MRERMSTKKYDNYAPQYAYYDNPKSEQFARLYADMAKSDQVQSLSPALKAFYYDCRIQSADKHAVANLIKHTQETVKNPFEDDTTWADGINEEAAKKWMQDTISYRLKNGYFTFPAKRLEEYGYNRCQASRHFEALIATGFIEKAEDNSKRMKENLYKFDVRWKTKTADEIRHILKELSEKYHKKPKKTDKK